MKNCLCFSHTIDVLFDYALPKISYTYLAFTSKSAVCLKIN